jgi:oligopeptide/dipeptide ABC transporter ATP-binding protein
MSRLRNRSTTAPAGGTDVVDAPADQPVLKVTDLRITYQPLGTQPYDAVSGLSFEVAPGSIVGVVGESGSGKSTASLALLGLTRGTGKIAGGSIEFRGRNLLDLTDTQMQKIRGSEIGFVTQQPRASLSPVMRIGDQISAMYRAHNRGVSKAEGKERALDLLRLVGINDPERRYAAFPEQLSGGMAQRVVIAMALSCGPQLLIADEPTSGLDVTVQAQILDDLVTSVRTLGTGLVMVTQDLSIVANYCDQVVLLHAGEVVEQAPVDEFFADPCCPASVTLLAAQRRETGPMLRLHGSAVDPRSKPEGCWLSSRCPFADADAGCFSTHPPLAEVGPDHHVRCLRVDAVREGRVLRGSE